mmetsp:Transcript_842/g.3030  ORF Transcript_842/g.3030 Transcript_842/m.3030 type:complete len:262 (-) Transcript_842:1935-2720(-)
MVAGRPPAGTKTSASSRNGMVLRVRMPSGVSAGTTRPPGLRRAVSNWSMGADAATRRMSSSMSSPSGSSAVPLPSQIPTTLTWRPYSRCRMRSMLPATSPSGPPVIFTEKGSSRGLRPVACRATSRNTETPSEVTPYSLWLMPAPGLDEMNAEGKGWSRRAARCTIHSMSRGMICSSGPRYSRSSGIVPCDRSTTPGRTGESQVRDGPRSRSASANALMRVWMTKSGRTSSVCRRGSTRHTAFAPPSGMSLFFSCWANASE